MAKKKIAESAKRHTAQIIEFKPAKGSPNWCRQILKEDEDGSVAFTHSNEDDLLARVVDIMSAHFVLQGVVKVRPKEGTVIQGRFPVKRRRSIRARA